MKQRVRLFKRHKTFYVDDTDTKKQTSLGTTIRSEAIRLLEIKREAVQDPSFPKLLLRTCSSSIDPNLPIRTWRDVMEQMAANALKEQTAERCHRAFEGKGLKSLQGKKLIETTSGHLFEVVTHGNVSTNHFMRRLHNLALGLGWIPFPILPSKLWPKSNRSRDEESRKKNI